MSELDDLRKEVEYLKGQMRATQDVTILLARGTVGKRNRETFSKVVAKLNKFPTLKKSSIFRAGYRAAVKKMSKDVVR